MTGQPEDESPIILVSLLVVEDFGPFRNFICNLVSKQPDFKVVGEASDGIEAVQKAEELKPDIIVIDIGLPRLDGISAAQGMRSALPNSKIVFLTSNADPQIARVVMDAGAAGFVAKTDGDELLVALRAVRRGKHYLSSSVEARCTEDL